MSLAKGNSAASTIKTAMIDRSKRDRSSIKCEMNVSCDASGVSLMAYQASNFVDARQRRLPRRLLGRSGRLGHRRKRRRIGRGPFVQLLLDAPNVRMEIAGDALHRSLEVGGRALDLLFQATQLVQFHLAIDVGLHFVDVALQASEQMSEHARSLRETLRTDDNQRHDGDDHDLGKTYVEHGMGAIRAGRGPSPLPKWRAVEREPAGGAAITLF